jgi:hypothetical protein
MTTLADVGRGVISERRELHGSSWVDCTQAAAMRACADAGVVFPLADLDQEREALERADDYPDEAGATMAAIVTAMQRRYGYSGTAVTDLHVALRMPGYTLLVQGTYPQFPSAQRRWSPLFRGGHAVAYRVLSEFGGTLLDPLAPMGFAGDTVTPAVMDAFAWGAATTRAMRWLAPPQTATGGVDMAVLGFTLSAIEMGTVTVTGSGHSAIVLRDGTLVGLAAGTRKRYAARIRLDSPFGTGTGRQDGFLVGDQAACLLATDVTAVPDAPAVDKFTQADIDKAIAADRAKARITYG